MLAFVLWILGLVLEGALLFRAAKERLLQKYPLFYLYLGTVLIQSLLLFAIYLVRPKYYAPSYWCSEFVSVVLGCGVIWEIYRQTLDRFPGAARMARNVLLFFLLMIFAKVAVNAWNAHSWKPAETTAELERNMRAAEAILLIALVFVFAHYAIPITRNLKGMILGYGFLIGTSLISLTSRIFLGDSFQRWWEYLQPVFYLAVLTIWCLTLWSYQEAPLPLAEPRIEEDYQLLAARTREGLLLMRTYLRKAMRP